MRYKCLCVPQVAKLVEVSMSVLKVITVGNSVGIIRPKEILERLRVKRGDSLYAIETKNGIELTAYNPEFAKQVEVLNVLCTKIEMRCGSWLNSQ
jgi:putative addiction module antidote